MTKARILAQVVSAGNVLADGQIELAELGLENVSNTADSNKQVLSAATWTTARTLNYSGDAVGSSSVDGSQDVTTTLTLSTSGVTAGTYGSATNIPQITVDAKGRVTTVADVAVLIPSGSLTFTGDVSGSGSTGSSTTLTLATIADSGTGTFKKITTNNKGLVTGTTSVTQNDITELLGASSISNTMLANSAVANLSGTNTGDETLTTIKTKLGISTLSGSNTGDQTITLTGDITGSGTGSFITTLANSGVDAGTYTKITVDTKGRVTSGTTLVATDIPNLDASKITTGVLDAARLPSYVDDVLEYADLSSFPVTGESSKIYVALDTNKTYRWSGSAYIEISASPGSTDAVAEGSVNLYFTQARARVSVSGIQNLSYNPATGVFTGPDLSPYQLASTAITTSNIESQSVNYASSAGNADTLDGQHGSYYQPALTAITTSNIGSQSVNYAASAGMASTATSAGNADTLDGQHGSYYQPASTAITTSNIGSQSVNYATSAGNAVTAASAFRAISAGSYGSGEVYGSNGGWSGIRFNTPNSVFMVRDTDSYSGLYKSNSTWVWAFDQNGALITGSVPGSLVTGTVASATTAGSATDSTKLPLAGGNLTGGLKEARVAMSANMNNIDLTTGNYFTKTISGYTSLTVSNVPSAGTAASFILDLTNGGSGTIAWWSGMKWAGGTAPILTASGRDALGFFTHDGGTTWTGLVLGKDVK